MFAATGGATVAGGDGSLAAWGCLLFFGVTTLILAWGLVGGRTLRLDADGFEATAGLPGRRPIRVRWSDVIRFSQVHVSGQTIVGFHLRPGAPPVISRLRRLIDDAVVPTHPTGRSRRSTAA